MRRQRFIGVVVAVLAMCGTSALAQTTPQVAPMPKECSGTETTVTSSVPLPNVAGALKDRKKIKILAIGGTSASLRGPVSGGHYAAVEKFLESTFKDVDVDVLHRGVSGELAADAGRRIQNEVALTSADLVLWQLGTADAMARVPIEDFKAAVLRTLTWLKDHKVDVIIVGLRYARSMSTDQHYQATRKAVQLLAKDLNVMRISRYEAEETLERARRQNGIVMAEVEVTEAGYLCLAEHIARTIAAGLFVKEQKPGHGVPAPPPK
jgi:lysophospholipase L1-like esterase